MTREHLHILRGQIDEIGRGFGVSDVRVFGSVAKGHSTSESDVDLLVRIEPTRSLLDLIGFEQSMCDLLQIKVDVVEEGGIHPRLEATILKEAQWL